MSGFKAQSSIISPLLGDMPLVFVSIYTFCAIAASLCLNDGMSKRQLLSLFLL
jgi:hypothetical protein